MLFPVAVVAQTTVTPVLYPRPAKAPFAFASFTWLNGIETRLDTALLLKC